MLLRALSKARKELSYKLCGVGLCVAPLLGKHTENNKNYLNSGKQDYNAESAQLQQMSFTYDLQGCPRWPCLNCHHRRLAQSFRWTNNPTQIRMQGFCFKCEISMFGAGVELCGKTGRAPLLLLPCSLNKNWIHIYRASRHQVWDCLGSHLLLSSSAPQQRRSDSTEVPLV